MCCSDNPTLKHANCVSVSICWRQSLNRTKHDKWQMFEPPNISQNPSTPFLFGALILFLYSTGLSSNTFKASSFHEDQRVRSVQGLANCVHCHLASCTENWSPNCLGPRLPEPHRNFPTRPLIGWDSWPMNLSILNMIGSDPWINHDNLVASTYSHSYPKAQSDAHSILDVQGPILPCEICLNLGPKKSYPSYDKNMLNWSKVSPNVLVSLEF